MPLLYLLIFSLTVMGLVFWLPRYRLQRAIRAPFPGNYSRILRRNIPAYARMPAHLQLQLKRLIKQFLHEKKFIGCDGFRMNDEVRMTIAGKACMLLLNRPARVFPDLKLVLVYPSAFIAPRTELGVGGIVTHANQTLSGESWSDGRVILAWDHVQQKGEDAIDGHNVVLHEFAHQLDSETGSTNGAPLLMSKARYQRWSAVMMREYQKLQQAAAYQLESVLDYYGATNPAEFFAVATETFFEKSWPMAELHPELFAELSEYYRVDPREWH
ncbi:zinc-dependent peptidase [Undibacterium sp. TJN25]|uniref:M90 family metallopeptidase n=1 Tax=Undibacterium sp. TJN25 TaxID=3413056 RepID=UPI003BF35101